MSDEKPPAVPQPDGPPPVPGVELFDVAEVPAGVPLSLTAPTATRGDRQAVVRWTPPEVAEFEAVYEFPPVNGSGVKSVNDSKSSV